MSKYEPLKAFLTRQGAAEVRMQFSEIEQILGASLPPSAFKHRAWWSNNPSNSVVTHAWLAAGYRTEHVDIEAGQLIFRRSDTPARSRAPMSGVIQAVRRALGGSVRVAPGFDLTAPTGDAWDADSQ